MARVEFSLAAVDDLDRLIAALSLPTDTRTRLANSLRPLEDLPRLGVELGGRWQGTRFVLGPWRWMLVVYEFSEVDDRVVVLTIQDARSSAAATVHR